MAECNILLVLSFGGIATSGNFELLPDLEKTTTIFKIAEPPHSGLYPRRNIHVRDEITCSDIANYLNFLPKKVSFE